MSPLRCARNLSLLLACAGSLATAGLARATQEDDHTQAPATPEPLSASVEGWGNAPHGDSTRFRELLEETQAGGWTWRLVQPFKTGELRAALRSDQTGSFLFKHGLGEGTTLTLKGRRDLALYAPRGRVEEPANGSVEIPDLNRQRERLSADVRHHFGGAIRVVSLTGSYDGDYGKRPDLSGGRDATSVYVTNTFDTPTWAAFDRRSFNAVAALNGQAGGVNFRGDVVYRYELISHDFHADDVVAGVPNGTLTMHSDDVRSTIAGTISGDASVAPGLLVGGLVRSAFSRGDPRTSRVIQQPLAPAHQFRSENVDLVETRHRAVLGAAWLPTPMVRTALRVIGDTARLEGRSFEDRQLGSDLLADGRTVWQPWSASGQFDAAFSPIRQLEIAALLLGRLTGGDDDVSRSLLTGTTTVGSFTQDATRSRQYGAGELRATVRATSTARVWVGERVDRDLRSMSNVTDVPTTLLVDRSSTRMTSFAGGRIRVAKHLSVEGKASVFEEDLHTDGAAPKRNGLDARVRVAGGYGPLWLWANGAWTDDRLDPREATPDPAFAPIDFRSRMLVAGGGATLATDVAFLSISGNEAGASGDPKSRLRDIEGTLGVPVAKKYVVSAAMRWLELQDQRAAWTNNSGIAGMLRFGATF
ncbi:MAG TPA: hypothetical protein VMV18_08075 [bacterium]|nr:hypothetical protein [bacterium]